MILVDTSVWIDFLRGAARAAALAKQLESGDVLAHPWIIGELALGHLGTSRSEILDDLRVIPVVEVLDAEEVLELIEARGLSGSGLGWVDAHLLGSALVAGSELWSLDRALARAVTTLGLEPTLTK